MEWNRWAWLLRSSDEVLMSFFFNGACGGFFLGVLNVFGLFGLLFWDYLLYGCRQIQGGLVQRLHAREGGVPWQRD